jgi:WD40 repeat protein
VKENRAVHRLEGSLLAFSPDSKRLATAEGQKLLQQAAVWDVETGRALLRLVNADGVINRSVAFTADGAFVVMAGMDTSIRTWDVETKE